MKKARKDAGKFPRPSKASLREIPEIDVDNVAFRPNPYAARAAKEGVTVHVARGRPKRGTETGPTVPRSIRFPAETWRQIEKRAKEDGLPLHAALRTAVLAWLGQHP